MEGGTSVVSRRAATLGLLSAAGAAAGARMARAASAQTFDFGDVFGNAYGRGCKVPSDIAVRAIEQNAAAAKVQHLIDTNPVLSRAVSSITTPRASETATRFDWRDQKVVTKVRNQGSCGSCWVFASIGAFEAAFMIANPKTDATTFEVSEQELLDCNFPENNCKGGFHHDAFVYLTRFGLIDANPNYPYDSKSAARGPVCNSNFGRRPYFSRNWGYVDPSKKTPADDDLKKALASGPLVSAVAAGKNWDKCRDGVLNETVASDLKVRTNHEVLIVGWDDQIACPGLPSGAWIVKNSWSEKWGDKGYVYVPYGRENIGTFASWVTAWPVDAAVSSAIDSVFNQFSDDRFDEILLRGK